MRILPVLDLMHGQVVRGVAGRRQEYRPIVSKLANSARPLDLARAFRDRFGLSELYLADLDAIAGNPPALPLFGELLDQGFVLWVDAGVDRWLRPLNLLADIGVQSIILGLESLPGPGHLQQAIEKYGSARIVFSLDLLAGRPLGNDTWNLPDAWVIAQQSVRQAGVRRIIVLDLAAVGVGQGTPTTELCCRLRTAFPDLEISTGGGVRDLSDLRGLQQAGVDNVLVASALHDGQWTKNDIK